MYLVIHQDLVRSGEPTDISPQSFHLSIMEVQGVCQPDILLKGGFGSFVQIQNGFLGLISFGRDYNHDRSLPYEPSMLDLRSMSKVSVQRKSYWNIS